MKDDPHHECCYFDDREDLGQYYVFKSLCVRPDPLEGTDWEAAQRQDPDLRAVMQWLKSPRRKTAENDNPRSPDSTHAGPIMYASAGTGSDLRAYHRERSRLVLRNNLVYRIVKPESGFRVYQFVVPRGMRGQALRGCHQDAGHPGRDRMRSLLRERFWWPTMLTDACQAVHHCVMCTAANAKGPNQKAPLHPIHASMPLELVHVDFLRVEMPPEPGQSPTMFKNILVISDHFTRFAGAVLCPDQTAQSAAGALWKWFLIYGFPEKILTDQGRAFESSLFKELCARAGISKLRTTPGHPECNGQVERLNRTLLSMIRRLTTEKRQEWDQHLETIIHAYNCTRSEVTGYSPFFLMNGRRPRIAVDWRFPARPTDERPTNRNKYVQLMATRLAAAHRIADAYVKNAAARNKRTYDKRARATKLQPGDLVLVRADQVKGRQKIQLGWLETPHEVVRKYPGDLPVYVVRNVEDSQELTRHRNKLLPIQLASPAGGGVVSEEAQPGGATAEAEVRLAATVPLTWQTAEHVDTKDEADHVYWHDEYDCVCQTHDKQ